MAAGAPPSWMRSGVCATSSSFARSAAVIVSRFIAMKESLMGLLSVQTK